MRILIYSLLLILFCDDSFSQAPGWVWADGAGGNSDDRGQCVFTDPSNGDVLVVGFYESAGITFGSFTLNNTLSNFTSDIFIAKYNSAGNVLWANTYGGTGSERANGVAVDANGNVIVTGSFDSPTISFGATTLVAAVGPNCFVLKLNSAGTVVWAKQSTGSESEYGTNIAVDNAGNIFVGGYFKSSTFSFDTSSASIIGAGSDDIFVAKFNAAGVCQWLNVAGGTKLDDLQGIAVDGNNDVIISGGFQSAALSVGASSLTNFQVNTYDAFIIKYTNSGALSWVTGLGGFYSENAMNVTTDNNNNIFITGYFETLSLTIGTTILTNTTSSGFLDIFTAKLNPSGAFQWAHSCGGIYDDYGSDVGTDAAGNVFVSGYYDSNTLTAGTTTLINNGSFDIVIAKYTNTGTLLWATGVNGGGNDRCDNIAVNNSGEAIITGYFSSSTLNFGTNTITNASDNDVFIAKLNNLTGLTEDSHPDWIQIYSESNPGRIHIQSQFPISQVAITNIVGQSIFFATPGITDYSVLVDKAGVYFVHTISNGVAVRKKVFVLR